VAATAAAVVVAAVATAGNSTRPAAVKTLGKTNGTPKRAVPTS